MQTEADEIRIMDADIKKPFKNGLEFNTPVHGTWNIVHIGLAMPEAVQIYVCAKNCMRGVILTAAEMGKQERFSFVILNEEDMVRGRLDEVTVEGVIDVIEKRDRAGMRPKAVQLFTVCTHHFLGTDYKRLYRMLREHFPDIDFYQCYMDPIMQKKGLTPDQKLRRAMLEGLPDLPVDRRMVAYVGSDFLLDESSELYQRITERGFCLKQMQAEKSYEGYLEMGRAGLFIVSYPPALAGVKALAKRLNRPYLYLPACFDGEAIRSQIRALDEALDRLGAGNEKLAEKAPVDWPALESACRTAYHHLKEKLLDTPICIDATVHPRPLGLARLLLSYGLQVKKVYLDAISPEEEADALWLKAHAPELVLSATIHVKKRRHVSGGQSLPGKVLAIGQKAAYFEQTPHFVNMVAGFGLFGYDGMLKLARMIEEAFDTKKDTRDIVPRKGLGCESCL